MKSLKTILSTCSIAVLVAMTSAPRLSAQDLVVRPWGIAIGPNEHVYFADAFANKVSEFDPATGTLTVVAGTGDLGFAGDDGPATAAQLRGPTDVFVDTAGNVYIADRDNHRVRKVDAATRVITTVAGSSSSGSSGDGGPASLAQLSSPTGVCVDGTGNIYIADTNNEVVRKVDAGSGNIETFAGDGFAGLFGNGEAATLASLSKPSDVFVDANGDLYIADRSNHRIRRVDASTGIISSVVGNVGEEPKFGGGFSGDGGQATQADLAEPLGVFLDGSGNIYIADRINRRVRKVDANTQVITTIAGDGTFGSAVDGSLATQVGLGDPSGVAVDADGIVYFTDFDKSMILSIGADGRIGIVSLALPVPEVSLRVTEVSGQPGATQVVVRIEASGTGSISSGEIRLTYDSSRLTVAGVNAGALATGSFLFVQQGADTDGELTIQLSGGLGTEGGEGTLAEIVFDVKSDAPRGTSNLTISEVTLSEPSAASIEVSSLTAGQFLVGSADFNGDGSVGFFDFLDFIGVFDLVLGDAGYDPKFDLDGDDRIGFLDFLVFVKAFEG